MTDFEQAVAAAFVREDWVTAARLLRESQERIARERRMRLPGGSMSVERSDVPASVRAAHAAQRETTEADIVRAVRDLRMAYGGAPLALAVALRRAADLQRVGGGAYDAALHVSGRSREPVRAAKDEHGTPLPWDTALRERRKVKSNA